MKRALLLLAILAAPVAAADPKPLFDGKTFEGWEGDTDKTWKIEDGAIVGGDRKSTRLNSSHG